MKSTTFPNSTYIKTDVNQEPLCISKSIIDLFLNQTEEKPADLIGIYCFYYYTGKWQATNRPKATTGYVASGLQISVEKARRLKKILLGMGLIEDIAVKDKNSGKMVGHYILVKYMWGADKIHPAENHEGGEKSTLRVLPGVVNLGTNALSVNNTNALSVNTTDDILKTKTPSIQERNKQYLRQAKKLSSIICKHKNIKHTGHQLKQWSNDFRILFEKNGVTPKRQIQVLSRYAKIYGSEYVPEAESGSTFRYKFTRIESAIERGSRIRKNKKIVGAGKNSYNRKPDEVIHV